MIPWTAVRESLSLLTPADRLKYWGIVLLQVLLSAMDLIGVLIIGTLGVVLVDFAGGSQQANPSNVPVLNMALTLELAAILASVALLLFVVKSLLSTVISWLVLHFLAVREAQVAHLLFDRFLRLPLNSIKANPTQEVAYALMGGLTQGTVVLLGQFSTFLAEATLLLLLGAALLIVDPLIAVVTILYFGAVAAVMSLGVARWSSRIGADQRSAEVLSLRGIQDALLTVRELRVRGGETWALDRLRTPRERRAKLAAQLTFLSGLPKYVYEIAMILGFAGLAVGLFSTRPTAEAAGLLALFVAAVSRVLPSLLRLQGAVVVMRVAGGAAQATSDLVAHMRDAMGARRNYKTAEPEDEALVHGDSIPPDLVFEHVDFSYSDELEAVLTDVNVHLAAGTITAIVGPSGSGKSTFLDIALGLLEPTSGRASIAGVRSSCAVRRWPGLVAYVPQSVHILDGTIAENVMLNLNAVSGNPERLESALAAAHLDVTIRSLPAGVETTVSHGGIHLSGGQAQRVGIARALFGDARLLVLDEATSALDAETEALVSSTLMDKRHSATIVIVAHRLSTVRNADQVIYLDQGRVIASGTYHEVLTCVPEFARQADLLGLTDPGPEGS